MIYKTAIDYARGNNFPNIVEVLSKRPTQNYKKLTERNKKLHHRIQEFNRAKRTLKNKGITKPTKSAEKTSQFSEETHQIQELQELQKLQEEVHKLKTYLSKLKGKSDEIHFFDIHDYEEESMIGEGGTSTVKRGKDLKNSTIKKLQRFLSEGEILSKLHHPCIIDIFGVNFGDDSHSPSIILSLEPKSLESSISNSELQEESKNKITVEIVLGMRYIHKRNFMHRDLKPANILLSKDNQVRISDFGLAKIDDMNVTQTKNVGTLLFMAPELFEDTENGVVYTNKVDVFAFGITLIYIVTDKYPQFSMKNTVNGIVPKFPGKVVGWVSDLIKRCLSHEAKNRPSFDEIFEALKSHNFDLFSEKSDKEMTSKQRRMKKAIEDRILEIEAFEYQHQED